jgi:hypothetical protein
MSRFTWLPRLADVFSHRDARRSRRPRPSTARRRVPLGLTQLEGRTLPSSFTASTVKDLINDINAANTQGGSNAITLAASTTFDLTRAANTSDGPTGLPVIAAADNLTITGQGGDIIQRDTSAKAFRLFDVANGATLTLNNLTLQNGLAFGSGSSAAGGAISNQGSLTLKSVIVQNNKAQGESGSSAAGGAIYNQGTLVLNVATVQTNTTQGGAGANGTKQNPVGGPGSDSSGGGIWSSGSLTCENGTLIQNNNAFAGNGGDAYQAPGGSGGNGGNAFGGGVFIAGGTANLAGVTLSGNLALGGRGGQGIFYIDNYTAVGNGGSGFGGGLAVDGGSVMLSSDTVENNTAEGQYGGNGLGITGLGYGGGLEVAGGTVTLCSDTAESNSAGGASDPYGYGGGIDIVSGATVSIGSSTVVTNNTDSSGTNGSTANIDGMYSTKSC